MQGKDPVLYLPPTENWKENLKLISQRRLKVNIRISSTRDTNLSFLVESPATF